MNQLFSFKQFHIAQEKCAMKVGTDGVLLGAWVNTLNDKEDILDIGCGTGLIGLMLAQRSPLAEITGIEIDLQAAVQAKENVALSKFNKQIKIVHSSYQAFASENKFDLIVTNPPFYEPNARMGSSTRKKARHTTELTFTELLKTSFILLKENGKFNAIIPYSREEEFKEIATSIGYCESRITRVRGRENTPIKRSLIELRKEKCPLKKDELTIEIERHQYTEKYINLVSAFYLKM